MTPSEFAAYITHPNCTVRWEVLPNKDVRFTVTCHVALETGTGGARVTFTPLYLAGMAAGAARAWAARLVDNATEVLRGKVPAREYREERY